MYSVSVYSGASVPKDGERRGIVVSPTFGKSLKVES